MLLAIAGVGTVAILFIPRAPFGNRQLEFTWNIFASVGRDYAEVRDNPTLYYTIIGMTWFGFLASFLVTVIPVFGKSDLGLPGSRVGLLFALLAIGVGIGSAVAGQVSHKRVEIGLVPIGSAGIAFSYLPTPEEVASYRRSNCRSIPFSIWSCLASPAAFSSYRSTRRFSSGRMV